MSKVRCPKCGGTGFTKPDHLGRRDICIGCRGRGSLPQSYWMKMANAQRLARLALKVKHG